MIRFYSRSTNLTIIKDGNCEKTTGESVVTAWTLSSCTCRYTKYNYTWTSFSGEQLSRKMRITYTMIMRSLLNLS